MKQLLLLVCIAVLSCSCIDKAYDLENVDTGDVTVGGDKSEFKMPLATITISMDQVGSEQVDIAGIFHEADVWLPSPLPQGANSVNLVELKPGTAYTTMILDALIDQMERDEQKLDEVTNLIWDQYRDAFIPLLGPIAPNNEAAFKTAFKTAFVGNEQIQAASRDIAQDYLIDMHVDPMDYQIGSIDLSSDVVDMLANNLDPEGTPNPKNTLHLYGQIVSELPVGMGLAPAFTNTDVSFEVAVSPDQTAQIPETQVFEADLRQIIKDANIYIPVTLLSYVPSKKFSDTQKIRIRLSLVKRGGLTLDI